MMIIPSILSDSLEVVADQLRRVRTETTLSRVQVDIVDPEFSEELTIHPIDLLDIDTHSLELDFHLMTNDPIQDVVECSQVPGVHAIIAQIERMQSQRDFIEHVLSYGIQPGISLDLYTDPEELDRDLLEKIVYIQVMGNKAGKQGQSFAGKTVLDTIATIKNLREETHSTFQIIVDIGMNPENAALVENAGAQIVTPGSYLWTAPDLQRAIESYSKNM